MPGIDTIDAFDNLLDDYAQWLRKNNVKYDLETLEQGHVAGTLDPNNKFELLADFVFTVDDVLPGRTDKIIDRLGKFGKSPERDHKLLQGLLQDMSDITFQQLLQNEKLEKAFEIMGKKSVFDAIFEYAANDYTMEARKTKKKQAELQQKDPERQQKDPERQQKDPERQDLNKAPKEEPFAEEKAGGKADRSNAAEHDTKPAGEASSQRKIEDALNAAVRQAGLTEEEITGHDVSRIQRTRSPEFFGVVNSACMTLNRVQFWNVRDAGEEMKSLKNSCISYLRKYPKVRSTQAGRDSYELALNLLAICAGPEDDEVRACIEEINAKRGVASRIHAKDHIDLRSYGPDRLLGRKKGSAELLKDTDKKLVEQARRAKTGDKTAQADVKRLQIKKLYIKTAVAPNGAADLKELDDTVSKLMCNEKLMGALTAATKDPKKQEKIMIAEIVKGREQQEGRAGINPFYEKAPEAQRKEKEPAAEKSLT